MTHPPLPAALPAAAMIGALCLLALSGCSGADADPEATPTVTTSTAPPTADPTGTPTTTPTTVPTEPDGDPIALPTDCTDIVDQAAYAATFAGIPLNPVEFGGSGSSSGVVTPTDPGEGPSSLDIIGASNELACLWRDPRSDVSGISVSMGHLAASVSGPIIDGFAAEGYTCTTIHDGRSCQLVTPDPQYPVDRTQTYFVRDDVVVTVDQTNVPTNDLIGSIATRLWG